MALLLLWAALGLLQFLIARRLQMTIADIKTQITTIQATVAEIAAKPTTPPVATQQDLDDVSTALTGVQSALDAIKAS